MNDIAFSVREGVFMNVAPMQINGLELSAKIMRYSRPVYPTHLVSIEVSIIRDTPTVRAEVSKPIACNELPFDTSGRTDVIIYGNINS